MYLQIYKFVFLMIFLFEIITSLLLHTNILFFLSFKIKREIIFTCSWIPESLACASERSAVVLRGGPGFLFLFSRGRGKSKRGVGGGRDKKKTVTIFAGEKFHWFRERVQSPPFPTSPFRSLATECPKRARRRMKAAREERRETMEPTRKLQSFLFF